ncbi:MAG: exopolysaccharide biosynthesis polyprenyl glycosylphosphotransferase [bacterium]
MADFIAKTKKGILLAGDILALFLALYLTLIIRYGYPLGNIWDKHFVPFSVVFACWLVIFFISDFYNLRGSYNSYNLANTISQLMLINIVVAVIIFYFFSPFINPEIKPQTILIIDAIIYSALLFGWRKIFYTFIKSSRITNRVLILGDSPLNQILSDEIKSRPQLGYHLTIETETPENLKQYCLDKKINILISSHNLKFDTGTAQKIFDCLSLGIDVYNINTFFEKITNQIPVEYIDNSWFLENLSEHSKKFYEIARRLIDVVLSIIGLFAAIFLTPFIALIIKLESPGPVIFRQIRTGKNGKDFLAMKFRSMVQDAEKNGAQWAVKNDARITKFGKFMRKTRLDEIPQLLNILRGEMSFVGPRPERPEFVKTLSEKIPFYRERLLVKPGLTGWAQLLGPAYGGSEAESLEKVKYDLYYIKNRSILLDISIILKTIKLVFTRRGQ